MEEILILTRSANRFIYLKSAFEFILFKYQDTSFLILLKVHMELLMIICQLCIIVKQHFQAGIQIDVRFNLTNRDPQTALSPDRSITVGAGFHSLLSVRS